MATAYSLGGCILKRQNVNKTVGYTSGDPISIGLIAGQNITLVKGKLSAVYDTGSTVTAAEDGLAKLVKGLKLQVNKGSSYMETIDLQQLVLYNQHLVRGRLANDQPSTTASQTGVTGSVEFFFSPSLAPLDPSNPNFAIPGQHPTFNYIDVVGTWGTDTDLGTGYTVSSNTNIKIVEQDGWVCDSSVYDQRFPTINGQTVLPNWQYGTHPLTSAIGNLGESIALPQDAVIRNVFIIVKDSSGNRSDSVVSDLAIRKNDGTNLWGPMSWTDAQRAKANDLDMNPLTGCFLWQLDRDVLGSEFSKKNGIQVNKYGEVQLRFTTTAVGSIEFIFDTLIPRRII